MSTRTRNPFLDALKALSQKSNLYIDVAVLFCAALYFFTPECFIYTSGHCLIGKNMLTQLGIDL